jgi:hypothetical protein
MQCLIYFIFSGANELIACGHLTETVCKMYAFFQWRTKEFVSGGLPQEFFSGGLRQEFFSGMGFNKFS